MSSHGLIQLRWAQISFRGAVAFVLLAGWANISFAAPAPSAVDFEREIVPVFVKRCAACHGGNDSAGGLNLLTPATAFKAGDSQQHGIVAGDSGRSQVIARIEAGEMPPKGHGGPVTPAELASLRRWIDAGATWPAERQLSPFEFTTDRRAGSDWWSLQPLRKPSVPEVKDHSWARTPIDRFILAELERRGIQPAEVADRVTFVRRAKLDLLGLPPTPDEVDAFVSDESPQAFENLIDRLLASPHYGERWGRHWLDIVRFGESHGFEMNQLRPNAWPYRDYVIQSFNADKPYAEFIREQLSGERDAHDVATSFLVAGPFDQVKSPNVELTLSQRQAELDDIVSTTITTFLGLTVNCAKCHDHKFDPISQQDYYALQAIFSGVQHGERPIESVDNRKSLEKQRQLKAELAQVEKARQQLLDQVLKAVQVAEPGDKQARGKRPRVDPLGNTETFAPVLARYVRFTILATNSAEPCLDEFEVYTTEPESRNVALASTGAKATSSGVFANGKNPIHQLRHLNDGHYGNAKSWISNESGRGWVQVELAQPTVISKVQWARDREGRYKDRLPTRYQLEVAVEFDKWTRVASSDDRESFTGSTDSKAIMDRMNDEQIAKYNVLQGQIESLGAAIAQVKPQMAYSGRFAESNPPTYRLYRGEPLQKRELVGPGAIASVHPPLKLSAQATEHDRRRALADWIADERHPLTARVMVNRIWHYHFGQGLVLNPSDFGFHSGQPSHPELLDWLAQAFLAHGGRSKPIHRLIMLSAVYRQSSRNPTPASAQDGGNRLLWRYPARRLEAEVIRDSILATSGELNLTMGGPGFDLFEPNSNYVKVYTPKQSFGPAEQRRLIYQQKPRMQSDGTFGMFDCPDSSQSVPRRNVSTTALQSLALFNSPFTMQQAEAFAERVRRESSQVVADQVRRAFALAFSRSPTSDEQRAALLLVEREGLAALGRALFNTNEMIFLP